MPIYEYQCKACNEKVEILQKLSDEPVKECPACHKRKLVKLVSAAGFRLKGGGWYETDFKSGSKKNLHAGENSSSTGENTGEKKTDEKSKSGSSESKPAKSETSGTAS